jgi:hypothetical protein
VKQMNIEKATLIDKLKENQGKHREKFIEAIEAYRNAVIEALARALDDAKARRKFKTYFDLPIPQDHSDDYAEVIGMLELEVEDVITLSRDDYRRFYLDNWEWKREFSTTSRTYGVSAE